MHVRHPPPRHALSCKEEPRRLPHPMFAPRRSQGGHPLSRRGHGATPLTCWAGRSTPGLAFSGSGSRSRCSSPFLGCMCRHRQVTPHSARMLVAVPSVAPSAITGTDSTMVPARGAGLGPAAAHPPGPARPAARRQAARGAPAALSPPEGRGGRAAARTSEEGAGPRLAGALALSSTSTSTPPPPARDSAPNPARALEPFGWQNP